MKPTDIKRLKKIRDFYAKLAEVFEKTDIGDDLILNNMLSEAKANKAYLEGYLDEAAKNEIIRKYGNVQGIVDTLPND